MLQIYNSLSKRNESFAPIDPDHVRMYVCGMTVYDFCHLGHARVLVFFDVVARYLRACGYRVTYVRNITDIDDKIIKRAAELGENINALTERFIQAMHEDTAQLGVAPPDVEPRATRHIERIKAMITALVDKGYAYQGANGDVYYDISKFDRYGALSGQQLGELRAGARVEIDESKEDPLDFVLWKAAKPGEPSWDSTWGPGRPGWHIECSAMSTESLGNHFDIHGGGMDLKFPHHESEIAQSEAATGEQFVNVWMHVGFVQIDQQKMSKSLGNFFTIREILERYRNPEVVRFLLLTSHYRSPLNYSDRSLEEAKAALDTLYTALRGLDVAVPLPQLNELRSNPQTAAFFSAMDDDFNTPAARSVLFDLATEVNRLKRDGDFAAASRLGACLRALGEILGLLQQEPEKFFQVVIQPKAGRITLTGHPATVEVGPSSKEEFGPSSEEVEALIEKRAQARKKKDWGEADRIRDELEAKGVVLEDGAGGKTTWRRR
jgi:cysteinyl-tRNA synthetase